MIAGRLAVIVHVGFVGETKNQRDCLRRIFARVECIRHAIDDELRHRRVHLAGQLDETRVLPVARAFHVR